MKRRIILISTAIFSLNTHAAGFALIEQSASGIGNAFASGSANIEDASAIYFNPASMTYLPNGQLAVAIHAIKPSTTFTNNGTNLLGAPIQGGNGGDPGGLNWLPNFSYTKAISDRFRLGIAVNSPFGLKTEYDANWVGRYQATRSELKTVNINPAVSFKLNDQISLGLGVSAMYAKADLANAIKLTSDGLVRVKGDDWALGWNMGAIFKLTDDTRMGLAYRSKIHEHLQGNVTFSNTPAIALFANGDIHANLTTPDSFSISLAHQINDHWEIMADATWTHWSTFKDLTVYRASGALSSTPENWTNTMRYSLGSSFRVNDQWKLRGGVAFDESPVPEAYRTARIPDNDRIWLSMGASYQLTESSKIDFAYAHLFIGDTKINKVNDGLVKDAIIGSYSSDVNIASLQYVYNF